MNDEWRIGEVFSRILNLFDTVATLQTDFLSNTVIASEAKQSSSYQEIASSLRSSQWHNNQFVCQFATVSKNLDKFLQISGVSDFEKTPISQVFLKLYSQNLNLVRRNCLLTQDF